MAIAVRPAQPSELDEILSIWLETQPLMPLWNYRYSHYREFPEDFHSYDRQWLADQLADSSKTFIVAETRDAPGTNAKTVVAASLWWMQGPKPWSTYRKDTPRRDLNRAHNEVAAKAISQTMKESFCHVDEDRSLFLCELFTRPSFGRRGAGTKLLEWGLGVAEENGCAVCLLASPMGFPLYRKMGFEHVGTAHIPPDSDGPAIEQCAMLWTPSSFGRVGAERKV